MSDVIDPHPDFTGVALFKLARADGRFSQYFHWMYRPWTIRSFILCRHSNRLYYYNSSSSEYPRGYVELNNAFFSLLTVDDLKAMLNGNIPKVEKSTMYPLMLYGNNAETVYLVATDKDILKKCGNILFPAAGTPVPPELIDLPVITMSAHSIESNELCSSSGE